MNRKMRRASAANGRSMMKNGFDSFVKVTEQEFMIHKPKPGVEVFKNSMYVVQAFQMKDSPWGFFKKVGVRRNDAQPIRSWSDMQRIKNEIFGADSFAIEFYPKESMKVDDANLYWFFVCMDMQEQPLTIS